MLTPKPKRASIEAINLEDEDRNIVTNHESLSIPRAAPSAPAFDYQVCMEPHKSYSTKTCDKSKLPKSILEAADRLGAKYNSLSHSSINGSSWSFQAPSACLREKLRKQNTFWRDGNNDSVACQDCARGRMPCFKWTNEGIFLLALHKEDRVEHVAAGAIVEARWVN